MPANYGSVPEGSSPLSERLQFDANELSEIPELQRTLLALREQRMPEPGPEQLSCLLAAMHDAQDRAIATNLLPALTWNGQMGVQLVHAVRSQADVIGLPFWMGSVLVLVMGVAVGHLWPEPLFSPLLFTAPPITVLGIGYSFRTLDNGMLDLERTSPVHPFELAFGRLVVIAGFDLLPALLLVPLNSGQTLLPGIGVGLVLDWLAPLILSSGISLVITQRYGAYTGSLIGLSVWVAYVALHVLVLRAVLTLTFAQGLAVWGLFLIVGAFCLLLAFCQMNQMAEVQDAI